jgi:hypothetical protein
MLEILSAHGSEAGVDYNDGDEVMGYFGWWIKDNVLTISYENENHPDYAAQASHRWLLMKLSDD